MGNESGDDKVIPVETGVQIYERLTKEQTKDSLWWQLRKLCEAIDKYEQALLSKGLLY